jgi:hypothetical protein
MSDPLRRLLDRLDVIRAPEESARLVAAARASEVARAWVEEGSLAHELRPYTQQLHRRVTRRRLDRPSGDCTELGLDGAGEVVRFGSHEFLLTEAGFAHRLGVRDGALREVELGLLDDAGRIRDVLRWTTNTDRREGDAYSVTYRVVYGEDDLPWLLVEWYDRHGISWVHRFVHDAGELVRVDGLRFDDHELPTDREQAIDELLAVIDRPSSVRVTWDAALRRREDVLPEPHQAFAGLGPPLADAVVAAVDEVRDRLGPLAFVSFWARPGWSIDDARLLSVRVADVTYRDRAREVVGDPLEVLSLMAFGKIAGAMEPDAFAHCPENVMQQVRAGLQATARQLEVGEAVGRRLTEAIAEALRDHDWGDVAPAFLVVFGDPGRDIHDPQEDLGDDDWDDDEDDEDDDWDDDEGEVDEEDCGWEAPERLFPDVRRLAGDAPVDAFLQSLRPTRKPPKLRCSAEDRAALAALLVEQGMNESEAQLAADASAWGIVFVGDEGGSRLGGPAVLPADMPWPTADGRPLTHLVTIACAELPEVEGRELLPADGHLAFFCDLSEDGLIDAVEPGDPRDILRIVHTPDGTPIHEPASPEGDAPIALRCEGRLQLPQWVPQLDAAAQRVLERVARMVNSPDGNQLLGHPRTVQDDPRDPGDINLLHFAAVEFADGGALQFYGPADAIKARDWDRITLSGSSC